MLFELFFFVVSFESDFTMFICGFCFIGSIAKSIVSLVTAPSALMEGGTALESVICYINDFTVFL